MADSQFEVMMDDCIKQNLILRHRIYRKDGNLWTEVVESSDVDLGLGYKMQVWLENVGSEISFSGARLSVHTHANNEPASSSLVAMYLNDTFSGLAVTWQNVTISPATLAPGVSSLKSNIYFKMTQDPDNGTKGRLLRIGTYASITPEGHSWTNITHKV
ncbi:MAG: hypothetical protein H7837_09400 [Magnetococcus sp. MYC-9]